jgi:hypothetical protein
MHRHDDLVVPENIPCLMLGTSAVIQSWPGIRCQHAYDFVLRLRLQRTVDGLKL